MKLFENESECLMISGLTVENRVDRVSFYGSIDFTKDKLGLKAARELRAVLDDIVVVLEGVYALPDEIKILQPVNVKSPFV